MAIALRLKFSGSRRWARALVRASLRRAGELMRAFEHRRALIMLAGADDRMLADIGLRRSDLRDAAARPLWQDPTGLLRTRSREKRLSRRGAMSDFARDASSPSLAPDGGEVATQRKLYRGSASRSR